MLQIKNLNKKIGSRTIINNISFSVNRGEAAVFLGSSGVGKSTLLRILNNLETAESGSITLDGKALDLSRINQTHQTGMVFQQFNLFENLSVLENITVPLKHTTSVDAAQCLQTARALLSRFGLADKEKCYPKNLSGGQKQRLALARAVALKPTILCLDEPTSALDPLLSSTVAHIIHELCAEGYIILISTHDTNFLEKIDGTIYLMNQGQIIETAPSADFKINQRKYPNITAFVSGQNE